jgi:hypothetical protein
MTRSLRILTGPVTSTKVKHYLVKGSFGHRQEMAAPRFLVIEDAPKKPDRGVFLYRFDAKGDCVGDTWHRDIEEAKAQAVHEYEVLVQEWQEIPPDADMAAFGVAKLVS